MTPPIRATYRLQFHAEFPLTSALELTGYLARLGVSHIHSSPLLQARPGSTHGYDVVDPTRLNPEIGSPAQFEELAGRLRQRGMGLVLDIVPNHMAAAPENPAWEDVLRHGPASPYARWFDIDWRTEARARWGRVLVPVLGDLRVRVLERDELRLALTPGGEFRVRYHDRSFPIDPATLAPVYRWIVGETTGGRPDDRRQLIERAVAELRALPPRRSASAERLRERRDHAEALAAEVRPLWSEDTPLAAAARAAVESFHAGDEGRVRIRRLLDAQPYRLVHWRRAAREINYRRFFDINDLIALHMEDPEVFRQTHRLVLEWVAAGWVDGFRVDHPDGLLDPAGYFRRLAQAAFPDAHPAHAPIYAEKILAPGEPLRQGWAIAGTTGYDFLNQAESLLIDPAGWERLVAEYQRLARRPLPFGAIARLSKRRALEEGLSAALGRLSARLARLVHTAETEGVPLRALVLAVMETLIYLPVYRTYLDAEHPEPAGTDRRVLLEALEAAARGRAPASALRLLRAVLLAEPGPFRRPGMEGPRLRFVERFQQVSGPAAAKGIEDTAFYIFVPLLSRNEVGGDPEAPLDDAVGRFHRSAGERGERWPRSMLAVTTHDTKRSADVRARLDVLSEVPADWEAALYRWRRWNGGFKRRVGDRRAPDVNTVYLLHQTLVGIWPLEAVRPGRVRVPSEEVLASLRQRVTAYAVKAAREAKQQTSWLEPDPEFEAALERYTDSILRAELAPRFLDEVGPFVGRIARPGMWNSLARTLLQLTAPGVPDLYQGDELWNFALVDPDNRRPVDFEHRRGLLHQLDHRTGGPKLFRELMAEAEDGRIKLWVISRALRARQALAGLFLEGDYRPLAVTGAAADRVVAFARTLGGEAAVTVVPRLLVGLLSQPTADPLGAVWGDTVVHLPDDLRTTGWVSRLTQRPLPAGPTLPVSALLSDLPVALITAG